MAKEKVRQVLHYDNVEIGTSDFRTLVGSSTGNGISVEPVRVYYDNLPLRDGWIKLNFAIGDEDKTDTVYFVDPAKITNEPFWVRGCNSLGKPHPTILKSYPHLMGEQEVRVLSVESFLAMCDISGIGFLKIDTEGYDLKILKAFLKTDVRPLKIQFESNELTDGIEYSQVINELSQYDCKRVQFDTVCEQKK